MQLPDTSFRFGSLSRENQRAILENLVPFALRQGNVRALLEECLAGGSISDALDLLRLHADSALEFLAHVEVPKARPSRGGESEERLAPVLAAPLAEVLIWLAFVERCCRKHPTDKRPDVRRIPDCVVEEVIQGIEVQRDHLQDHAQAFMDGLLGKTSAAHRTPELTRKVVSLDRLGEHLYALIKETEALVPLAPRDVSKSYSTPVVHLNLNGPSLSPFSRLATWALGVLDNYVEDQAMSECFDTLADQSPSQRATSTHEDNLVLLHLFMCRFSDKDKSFGLWSRLYRHCPWLEFETFLHETEKWSRSFLSGSDDEELASRPRDLPTAGFDYSKLSAGSRARLSPGEALVNWLLLPHRQYLKDLTVASGPSSSGDEFPGLAVGSYTSIGTYVIKRRALIQESENTVSLDGSPTDEKGEETNLAEQLPDVHVTSADDPILAYPDALVPIRVPLGFDQELRDVLCHPPDPKEASARELLLVELVGELKPVARTILTLWYCEDLDAPEIARRLGMKDSAVRQRKCRAREFLKTRFELQNSLFANVNS